MNDLTCSMRYPGQNITDLRKHAVNLVVFPRLHFLQFSHGPYFQFDKKYVPPTMVDIKESLFGESAFMTNMNPNHGKWLSSSIIFRGQISSYESKLMAMNQLKAKSSYFAEWIPNNINNNIVCDKPPRGHIMSGTMLSNHTSILEDMKA